MSKVSLHNKPQHSKKIESIDEFLCTFTMLALRVLFSIFILTDFQINCSSNIVIYLQANLISLYNCLKSLMGNENLIYLFLFNALT